MYRLVDRQAKVAFMYICMYALSVVVDLST